MRIAEIYRSVQGEGRLTGTESVFVRTSGCNLRCWFCDSPFTSWAPEGTDMTVPDVVTQVTRWECGHVVLTGGEPMIQAELAPLSRQLRRLGKHITIETAGTRDLAVECDLMSISPKLASSAPPPERDAHWSQRHERMRHAPDVVRRLAARYDYQVKFVIDSPEDCRDVERYLNDLAELDRQRVLLMPQGTDLHKLTQQATWLEPYCRDHDLTFCPRKHIEWFGLVRGT
jgi:7-carboxy-7-deazaguanine synthase